MGLNYSMFEVKDNTLIALFLFLHFLQHVTDTSKMGRGHALLFPSSFLALFTYPSHSRFLDFSPISYS